MNRRISSHGSPRIVAAMLVVIALGAGACVHKPYIQQGNYLETKDVDQVTAGMTRSRSERARNAAA